MPGGRKSPNTAPSEKLAAQDKTFLMQNQQTNLAEISLGQVVAYVKGEIEGHQLSIAQTNKEISSASNADVKAFAFSYLPKAQEHGEMARTLTDRLSVDTARAAQASDLPPAQARSCCWPASPPSASDADPPFAPASPDGPSGQYGSPRVRRRRSPPLPGEQLPAQAIRPQTRRGRPTEVKATQHVPG